MGDLINGLLAMLVGGIMIIYKDMIIDKALSNEKNVYLKLDKLKLSSNNSKNIMNYTIPAFGLFFIMVGFLNVIGVLPVEEEDKLSNKFSANYIESIIIIIIGVLVILKKDIMLTMILNSEKHESLVLGLTLAFGIVFVLFGLTGLFLGFTNL